MSGYATVECGHRHCDMKVIEVRLGSKLERTFLHPDPVPWPDGKVRVHTFQANPDLPPLASRVTRAQAFGLKRLYRPHSEVCKGQQRRTRQKATAS